MVGALLREGVVKCLNSNCLDSRFTLHIHNFFTRPKHTMVREPRNLVLCIDGTGKCMGVEEKETNVAKLRSILVNNETDQICYYEVLRPTFIFDTLT